MPTSMIGECSSSEPAMAFEKEAASVNTASVDTMTLEEDEHLMGEDLSQLTEFVSSCCLDDDEDDDDDEISCSSDADEDDEIMIRRRQPICSPTAAQVKFCPMATRYLIMSRDEYTEEEIEETWWTPKQRQVLNRQHNKTVDRLEAGLKEKKSAPYRGLEKIAAVGYQQLVQAKNAYVDTVMDEMERQWKVNDDVTLDWEQIANLTQDITRKSLQEAIATAVYDEADARVIYAKRKSLRSSSSASACSLDSSESAEQQQQQQDNEEQLESDEAFGKLGRLNDSSIRMMERGFVSPMKTKKKKKVKGLKKKKKKSIQKAKNLSSYEEDGDLTEVDFSDVFGDDGFDFPDLGEEQTQPSKKKKTKKTKKAITKNDATTAVTTTPKKKKKKVLVKKTSSLDLDESVRTAATEDTTGSDATLSFSSLPSLSEEPVVEEQHENNNQKNLVSQFASSCMRRIRAT